MQDFSINKIWCLVSASVQYAPRRARAKRHVRPARLKLCVRWVDPQPVVGTARDYIVSILRPIGLRVSGLGIRGNGYHKGLL